MTGCGGSSQPISVGVTAAASTVDGTDSTTVTATVTNDQNSAGVTWSVSGGGTLSNTTSTGATYTAPAATSSAIIATVTATSKADNTKSGSTTINIPAAPAITTTALTASVGTAFNSTLAGTGGIPPYKWALTSGTLPTGWSLTAAGVVSGPAPVAGEAGTINLTVGLTDSGVATALTASQKVALTINPAPTIVFGTPMLPAAVFNTAYTGAVSASGGAGALTYSVATGALPNNVSLNGSTGAITGTPTRAGAFNFTIQAADAFGDAAVSPPYGITVSYPPLKITPSGGSLPVAYAGSAYSTTLTASGGSGTGYTWTAAGLPSWLSIAPATGVLSGTPTTAASAASFTVTVTDSASNVGNGTYSVTVDPGVSIAPPGGSLPTAYARSAYSTTLTASGGTGTGYTWSATGLPSWLSIAPATGVLSGTPNTAAPAATITVKVVDSAGNTASGSYNVTVKAGITIAPPGGALPAAYANALYSQTLTASGGTGTGYAWAGTNLPSWLSISPTTGVLSGTPTTAPAAFDFTVTVTDSANNTDSANFTLAVNVGLSILPSGGALPAAYVGALYSTTLTGSGGSATGYAWSATGLPSWLSIAPSTGILSGTPTTAASAASFTVKLTDSASNTVSGSYSVTVDPGVSIAPSGGALPTAYVGAAYSTTLTASGGSGTGYTWSATGLPSWLSIAPSTGVLSGTPTATASAVNFTVKVTDSVNNTASGSYNVTVDAGLTITTTSPLHNGFAGQPYFTTLATSGGTGTGLTWTVTSGSGSLAAVGLAVNSTGDVEGLAPVAGSATFTVKVTDSASNTASATFTVTIGTGLTITTPSTLPEGFVGTAYSVTLQALGGTGTGRTWAVTSGSASLTAVGLSVSGAGLVSGPTPIAGSATFTVKVTDSGSNSASETLTVTIGGPLTITTSSPLPGGYAGTPYSTTLATSGGSGTGLNWNVTSGSGSLTAVGLSVSAAGVVSGATPIVGSATFTVSVTDSASNTTSKTFTVTIAAGLTITTTSPLLNGYAGTAYSSTLATSGGTGTGLNWTVTSGASNLAAVGLSVSGAGVVSGAAPVAGAATFTVSVTDSASNTASKTFTVTIEAKLAITTTSPLPSGIVTTNYSDTLAATGGTGSYTWSVTAGATQLAAVGLALNPATGVLSGTTATLVHGSATFTVQVADTASHTAMATLSVTINASLNITTTTLPPAYTGTAYSTTLAAVGGSGGNTWSVTTNLAGLTALGVSLNAGTGVLSATGPGLVAGSATFTVQVKDSSSDIATQSLTMNVYTPLSLPASGALPAATTNVLYHDTVTAVGGSGSGYVFTVNGTALPTNGTAVLIADGISVKSIGNQLSINGTPTLTQTVTLTVSVVDSLANSAGPDTYTILVNPPSPLALPAPGALAAATTNVAYNSGITATGGSGSGYVFTVNGTPIPTNGTPVLIADGLSVSSIGGATLSITGTPTLTQQVSLTNVTVVDSASDSAGPDTYSIAVNPPAPLTLPTAGALTSATTNVAYTNSINASGGSGSGYVFTVNGTQIPTTGSLVAISDGISVSNNGSNSLSISGTPTAVATVTLTNVKVKDGAGDTAGPDTYTIDVNTPGNQVSGTISLNNGCGNTTALPTFNVSINTTPVQNTTTDSSGNYSFASVANGTYTITPSIAGASSVFYPTTLAGVVVDNAPVGAENFTASVGYIVSGTVAYSGTLTGPIYVELENQNCGGSNAANGTTLAAPGAFTIRGVSPGSYNLQTWRDNLGFGEPNASNPTGSVPSLTVSNANLTGIAASLADPGTVTLSTAPKLGPINGFANGAFVNFKALTNSNGEETATSYTLQWSTTTSFTSPAGSTSFAATGGHDNGTWILNAANVTGLTAGQSYYFRLQGVAGTSTSAFSSTVGPVPITAPPPANTITGQVTFNGTATGPLYVGFYDGNTNQIWATVVGSHAAPPTSPAAFTVEVPSGTYQMFGIIDQNNNGLIDPGDINNVNGNNGPPPVTISGSGTQNETLPSANSTLTITTQFSQFMNGGNTTNNYNLDLDMREGIKLPIDVTLTSGPNLINPVDMGGCGGSGCGSPQFQYNTSLGTTAPHVGDTYNFNVTYSDGTSGTVSGAVTGVLGASALPTLISPTGTGVSDTPDFDWTYPANPGNYLYQFYVCCTSNTIWSIPGQNSNANGFTNTQITPPLLWAMDPTDSTNLPNPATLSPDTQYNWSLQAQDINGNSAYASASFTTTSGTLALPSSAIPGGALVGLPYTASLTATGGTGGDVFEVNGTTVPTSPSTLALSDGLTVTSSGSTLTVSGTPTSASTVTLLDVTVTDSSSDMAGPKTYTIAVSSQPTGTNNSYLSGTYVCEMGGLVDSDGSEWASLFSLTANGSAGTFTNGIFDSNGNNSTYYPSEVTGTVTGTYNVGADFNGLATFSTSPSLLGTTSSQWAIALTHNASPAAEFRMVEIDDVGSTPSGHHGTGDCFLATTSAFAPSTVSGNGFVFQATGTSNGGGPKTIVGRWTNSAISGSSGTVTSGTIDQAKNIPTTYTNIAFTGGSYTLPASPSFATYGRYTLTFSSGLNSVDYVVYVIDSGRMFLLGSTGVDGTQAGHARTQKQASYSAANLNSNFVLYSEGLDNNGTALSGAYSWIAQAKGDGAGNLTFNESYNDQDGVFTSGFENGGPDPVTFDSANPGRVTMAAGASDTLYYYLYDNNSGFVMNVKINPSNGNEVDAGWIDAQTQTTFSDANLAGEYMGGQFPPLSVTGQAFVGELDVLSNGTADAGVTTAGEQEFQWDQPETSLPYTFTSTTYGSYSLGSGARGFSCIGISSTKTVCIENVEGAPGVAIFQE